MKVRVGSLKRLTKLINVQPDSERTQRIKSDEEAKIKTNTNTNDQKKIV